MLTRLISAAIFSTVIGLTLAAPQAEARRLFWWQSLPPEYGGGYDVYGDGQDATDGQDAYATDLFNQEQYDQYMREMNHRRHKRIYDQSYYDPQMENPDNPMPHAPKYKVKKPDETTKTVKVKPPIAPKPTQQATAPVKVKPVNPKVATLAPPPKNTQGTESITDDVKAKTATVTCAKGASIVSSYGFSAVTSKTCTGKTYVYGASRSGSNFEIQVSAANGELTAVKKL